MPEREHSDDYYNYNLRGVVVHMGTAEFGHYYSFIGDREHDKWYEFNDTFIREMDKEDIAAEAFGGEERWSWGSQYTSSQFSQLREKHRNAYLLFYERKGVY